MLRIAALALAVLLSAATLEAKNLYVNNTGSPACSDATTYANNTALLPWCTIGRAVWGNASRSSPSSAQAAAAGDVVLVTGSTYDASDHIVNRLDPLYNTTNSGTLGNYIEIRCIGDCTLTGAEVDAPAVGVTGKNYVKWFADISLGYSWIINACGEDPDEPADTCGAGTFSTTPDTGPGLCHVSTGCWLEGFVISGGAQLTYNDNYNAVRFENSTGATVRNSVFSDFRNATDNHNASGVTLYGCNACLVEHLDIDNVGAGVYFKDAPGGDAQTANVVRFIKAVNVGECFAESMTGQTNAGRVVQNTCNGFGFALEVTGGGGNQIDWINNSFYNGTSGGVFLNSPTGTGDRFFNNIIHTVPTGLVADGTWPAATAFNHQHGVVYTFTNFYNGTDGNRTLASFNATYTDQNQTTPVTITTDPLFVNTATGDFHLQGGSPALALGVDVLDLDGDASTSDNIPAGAYVTGSEVIGIDVGGATAPDPPTIGTATAGNGQCVVTFTPPADDGGSTITGYTATSSPSSITGTGSSSPITVTGLSNGTGYTFTVTATNAQGTSSPSSASNSCTPTASTAPIRVRLTG